MPTVSARNRSCEPLGPLQDFTERIIVMSAKLFVGNLSHETTSDELNTLFSEVGVVDSCNLIVDRETDRSKGFAFIEMNSKEGADAAKEKFNGQDLHGRALKVNDAKPKNDFRNNGGSSGSQRH
jgi:RNA recognition motif-containing protein